MDCDHDELNLGASAHLLVTSWLQKAEEDGGNICLAMAVAGVVGSLAGCFSLKET